MSRDKSWINGIRLRLGQVLGLTIHHSGEPAQVTWRGVHENRAAVLETPLVRVTHATNIEFLDRIASQGSHAVGLQTDSDLVAGQRNQSHYDQHPKEGNPGREHHFNERDAAGVSMAKIVVILHSS